MITLFATVCQGIRIHVAILTLIERLMGCQCLVTYSFHAIHDLLHFEKSDQ